MNCRVLIVSMSFVSSVAFSAGRDGHHKSSRKAAQPKDHVEHPHRTPAKSEGLAKQSKRLKRQEFSKAENDQIYLISSGVDFKLSQLSPIGKRQFRKVLLSTLMGKTLRTSGFKLDKGTLGVLDLAKEVKESKRSIYEGMLRALHVNKRERKIILEHRLDPAGPKKVPLDILFEITVGNIFGSLKLVESEEHPIPLRIELKRSKDNRHRFQLIPINAESSSDLGPIDLPYGQEVRALERLFIRQGQDASRAAELFKAASVHNAALFNSEHRKRN